MRRSTRPWLISHHCRVPWRVDFLFLGHSCICAALTDLECSKYSDVFFPLGHSRQNGKKHEAQYPTLLARSCSGSRTRNRPGSGTRMFRLCLEQCEDTFNSVCSESRFSDPQPRFVRDQGSRADGGSCCTLADRFEVQIGKLGVRFN
ncbi:hypothetical protein LSAT2_002199 [Lamellibrachia satsuma]|nr:hypothetical protein LSAT2_002199 [Lamellibrachia satsuma]